MAPLWKLCANGKVTEVKAALAKGADVNGRNGGNETALMTTAGQVVCQCHGGCQEVILKLLLEQPSIKVNLVDMEGCTALHYAASEGHRDAVALLIADKRVDVNCKDSSQRTPLLMAAASNFICIVKLLLADHRVEVNHVTKDNNTALHIAAKKQNTDIVELLLADPRVDVNCKDSQQMTPLVRLAVSHGRGYIDVLKLFLAEERVDVNLPTWAKEENGELTALMWSVMNSNLEAAKLLLDNPRVDVSWKNSLGLSALHMAFSPPASGRKNSMKVLQLLLAHPRVDVNYKDLPGMTTVLHVAAGFSTLEAVKLILAEPSFTSANALAEIEEFSKAGRISALGVAAAKGKCEIFKEMVLHPSIDLGVKNEEGLDVDDWVKDCPNAGKRKRIKKILQEGRKTRQKRAEAEASKDKATAQTSSKATAQDSAQASAQASASGDGDINDKAESICWFCHADVTSLRNNRCAGCKKARYCCVECAVADWDRHREYCVFMQQKIKRKMEAKKAKKAE